MLSISIRPTTLFPIIVRAWLGTSFRRGFQSAAMYANIPLAYLRELMHIQWPSNGFIYKLKWKVEARGGKPVAVSLHCKLQLIWYSKLKVAFGAGKFTFAFARKVCFVERRPRDNCRIIYDSRGKQRTNWTISKISIYYLGDIRRFNNYEGLRSIRKGLKKRLNICDDCIVCCSTWFSLLPWRCQSWT